MPELYEMVMTATGEVRDVDGNLLSSEPVEVRKIVTREQAEQIAKAMTQGEPA